MASPNSRPGTLHNIAPNLSAFEPSKPLTSTNNTSTLIWIGGLSDTYSSVAYPYALAQSLGPTWSLMLAALSSTGNSWGTSSIARDAEEMAKIVSFVRERRPNGKVVIMLPSENTLGILSAHHNYSAPLHQFFEIMHHVMHDFDKIYFVPLVCGFEPRVFIISDLLFFISSLFA